MGLPPHFLQDPAGNKKLALKSQLPYARFKQGGGIVGEINPDQHVDLIPNGLFFGGIEPWFEFNAKYSADANTVDTVGDTINQTSANPFRFQDGDRVLYTTTGTVITGLTADTEYYVISAGALSFQLSATKNGPFINFTGAGTGTHTFTRKNFRVDSNFEINPSTSNLTPTHTVADSEIVLSNSTAPFDKNMVPSNTLGSMFGQVVTVNSYVTKIRHKFYNQNIVSGGKFVLEIRSTTGSPEEPTNELLAVTGVIDPLDLPISQPAAFQEVELLSGFQPSPSQKVAIVLRLLETMVGSSPGIWTPYSTSNPYAGGHEVSSVTGGSVWTKTTANDMAFEIVSNAGQVAIDGFGSMSIEDQGNDYSSCGVATRTIRVPLSHRGRFLHGQITVRKVGTVTDDMKITAFDNTNNVEIPAVNDDDGQFPSMSTLDVRTIQFKMYIPEGCEEMMFALFAENYNTGSGYFQVSDIRLVKEGVVSGAIVTDWESWTPTGSWTTNVTYTGKMRRVGDSLEAQVKVLLSGAPNSTELTINLPNALTIDSDKVLAAVNPGEHAIFGDGFGWDYSASPVSNRQKKLTVSSYWYSSTGFDRVKIYYQDGGATAGTVSVDQTSPITWASNDVVSVTFKVPIKGWSATALISTTENYTKGAYVNAYNTNNQLVTQNIPTPLTGWTEVEDSHNAFDPTTGIFTAPRDGRFAASFTYLFGATITTRTLNYINHYQSDGSTIIRRYVGFAAVANTESGTPQTACVKMNKGEKLKFEALHSEASARNIHASGDLNHLTVVEVLDKREWGTFGEDEYLSAYSATFTPGATGLWHGLTGNSVLLTPGVWLLNGAGSFGVSGPAVYSNTIIRWAVANGNNTSTAPAALPVDAGYQDMGHASYPTDFQTYSAMSVRVTITTPTTVYLVPFSAEDTPGNARINVSIYAQRLV